MKDLKKEIEYNLVLEFKEITAPFPLCPICKQALFPDGFFVLNYKCRRCRKNFEQSVKNGKWAEVIESSLLDQVRLEERKKTLEEVWGFINEKMDTLDINKHEPEINILSWLNKKIDFNITMLSKITKRGK